MPVYVQIPGYREACELERTLRDESWLACLPVEIGGVQCKALTIHLALMLDIAKSPWMTGARFDRADAAQFLWIVSEQFSLSRRERERFTRKLAWKWTTFRGAPSPNYDQTISDISEYMERAFMDASNVPGKDVPFTSWVAATIDTLASEYSWARADILNTPLAQAFQLDKQITLRRTGKKERLSNRYSDAIKAAWLAEQNAMKEAIGGN